jgi:hypothetical protein
MSRNQSEVGCRCACGRTTRDCCMPECLVNHPTVPLVPSDPKSLPRSGADERMAWVLSGHPNSRAASPAYSRRSR